MRFPLISTILSFLILLPHVFSVQYCEQPLARRHPEFCLGLNSVKNLSSQGTDVYFSLSTQFIERKGWFAIAPGPVMNQALMFVIYPGQKSDGKPRATSKEFKNVV